MEKYRKPDQFYIDHYDRATIRELKELEAKESAELQEVSDPQKQLENEICRSIDYRSFKNKAIERARNRESTIRQRIESDERQDKLVATHPLPTGITCDFCGAALKFSLHFFDVQSIPLLFIFECPAGHAPRKAIYPDGREYIFPRPTCG